MWCHDCDLVIGPREFGRDFDTTAPPHETTAQTYVILCHYLCQIMSFNQDGSGHTETLHLRCFTKRLHFSIVEVETCRPSFCFYSPWLCCFRVEEEFFPCHQN